MSASQLASYGSVGVTDNTTRFLNPSGQLFASQATEANAELPVRTAVTIRHLFARVPANTATNGSTITVRKSRADTAITVAVGGDATGEFEDIVNSDSFAATDELDIEVTVATEGGTNTITLSILGVTATPAAGAATVIGASGGANLSAASTTSFWGIGDRDAAAVDEARHEWAVRKTFTASHLFAVVTANARTTDTVVRTRKNRANGAASVTFASGETGTKEDTSNTDALASGDEFNCAITTGTGAGTITFQNHGVNLTSAGPYPLLGAGSITQAFGVTNYFGFGDVGVPVTTEATAQMRSRFSTTLSQFSVNVTGNTLDIAGTARVRINGANGNQVVGYVGGETGHKTDSSNTDALDADDLYNVVVDTSVSGSGALTYRGFSLIGEVPSGLVPPLAGVLFPTRSAVAYH